MTEAEQKLAATTSHSRKKMVLMGIVAKEHFPDRLEEIEEHLAVVTETKSVDAYALLEQYGSLESLLDNSKYRASLLARISLDNVAYVMATKTNADLDRWYCGSEFINMPIPDQLDYIGTFLNGSIVSIEKLTLMSLPTEGPEQLEKLKELLEGLDQLDQDQMEPMPDMDDTQSQQ